MKRIPYLKFDRGGILWSPWTRATDGETEYSFYFYWWNPLSKNYRYWGYRSMWYDGGHESFGFGIFNWSWSIPGSDARVYKQIFTTK